MHTTHAEGVAVSTADGVLFPDPTPPIPEGIDLRCCDVGVLLDEVRGARLVHADPPWDEYQPGAGGTQRPSGGFNNARPDKHYPTLRLEDIGAHLSASAECAAPGGRLAVWHTWPLLSEALQLVADPEYAGPWREVLAPKGWRLVTGGAWTKDDPRLGVGFHWLGHSEPVLVYVKPGAAPHTDRAATTRNGHASPRGPHSEKPIGWLRPWLQRWTEPDDLTFDLYAGLGSMARACLAEGRRYVGAEIDEARHARALGLLAGRVGLRGDL